NDGMASVGPAVVANHDIVLVSEEIDDLAFGLVAPLQADDTRAGHGGTLRPVSEPSFEGQPGDRKPGPPAKSGGHKKCPRPRRPRAAKVLRPSSIHVNSSGAEKLRQGQPPVDRQSPLGASRCRESV